MPADKKWTDVKCTEVDEKKYKVKEFYDDRFGDIHLMTPKEGSKAMIFRKDYITNSQKEAMTKLAVLAERRSLQHSNMSTLLGWAAVNKKDFCNNHYEISAYYDFPSTCARTWDNAAGVKGGLKPVNHDDLTHMVYQLLIVESHLNANGRCYQDVRPTHVGVRNFDKSDYELVDRLRYPMDAEEVNTNHMLYGQLLYCSPELFKFVVEKNKKKKCDDNRAKSDVFSIGMTVLALGLDHSVQDCYDMKKKKFDEDKLNGYVHDFDNKFGHENKLLCDIVRYCLEVKDSERFTAQELLDRVESYATVANYLRYGPQQPVEVEVETRPPVVVREEVVTENVRPTVTYGDARPVAVYKIVNGERILVEGTEVDFSKVVRSSRVAEGDSQVVRRSVQGPTTVVRRSHVEGSRVVVADGTTSNVVRRSRRVVQGGYRSSRVVEGGATRVLDHGDHVHVQQSQVVRDPVRVVDHGDHAHLVGGQTRVVTTDTEIPVRQEGTVRRVEGARRVVQGDSVVGTGNVRTIRRVDGPTTTTGNVVRRVSGDAPTGNVVRRVSGDAPVEGVVRRVSDAPVEGVRRVSGDATEEVVRKVSGDNVERKVSGSS